MNQGSQGSGGQYSMMQIMYTPTFGNGSFAMQPQMPGEIDKSFPSIPYLPIEAIIYQQQASNPSVAPVNVMSGQNVGQQNVQGTYTVNDQSGDTRIKMGFDEGVF